MKKKTINEMLMDPNLGESIARDLFRAHKILSDLNELHEFCANYSFSYGMHPDGSVYILDFGENDAEGLWWARLFNHRLIETYFWEKKYHHLGPVVEAILLRLKNNNIDEFQPEENDNTITESQDVKKYIVTDKQGSLLLAKVTKNLRVLKYTIGDIIPAYELPKGMNFSDYIEPRLTEEEIKQYDENFWAFRQEVDNKSEITD